MMETSPKIRLKNWQLQIRSDYFLQVRNLRLLLKTILLNTFSFSGGQNCLHCLTINDIEKCDDVDKETRKVDLETSGTVVKLPSNPTHLVRIKGFSTK